MGESATPTTRNKPETGGVWVRPPAGVANTVLPAIHDQDASESSPACWTVTPTPACALEVERIAPGVIARQPVKEPMATGLKAIDSNIATAASPEPTPNPLAPVPTTI